jgi:hypothetical protein
MGGFCYGPGGQDCLMCWRCSDGADQLRGESGVSGAATCSLRNGGAGEETRLAGSCCRRRQCSEGKLWAVEPSTREGVEKR